MDFGTEKLIMVGLKVICVSLLAGVIGVVLVQQDAISNLHNENRVLQEQQRETARLAAENQRLPNLRKENDEAASLRQANRDLPRLRNEVRQLREAKKEIENLSRENQRLATATVATQPKPNALVNAEDYVPAEKWTYGLGSPEAAIQTWFLAMREGNWQQFHGVFSPVIQKELERQFGMELDPSGRAKPDEQRLSAKLKREMASIARISGYQIATKEQLGEDTVVLGIRAAVGGEVMKIQLKRYGTEWKIADDPK